MPNSTDPASQKQMQFLWNLIQGAHEMQLGAALPEQFQTEASATAAFQAGLTKGDCSTWIEDAIFRVGAVPPGSRTDRQGNVKMASQKQIDLYNSLAAELAAMGDTQWTQHQMAGRYSWTVSKFINKLIDEKDRANRQSPPQQGTPPPWGAPPAQSPAPVPQPAPAAAQAFQPVAPPDGNAQFS